MDALALTPITVGSRLSLAESKRQAEMAVSDMLSNAYEWIGQAITATNTDPLQAKEMRAAVYTIEEATRQRDLSNSIKMDAQEMARRADYALGKAIRDGQANGTIGTSQAPASYGPAKPYVRNGSVVSASRRAGLPTERRKSSPAQFLRQGSEQVQVYQLVDNVSPDEFDGLLSEAREEKNLSRANVARKAKALHQPAPTSPPVVEVDPDTGEIIEPKCPKRTAGILNTIIANATPSESVLGLVEWGRIPPTQAAEWHAQINDAIKALKAINTKLGKAMK